MADPFSITPLATLSSDELSNLGETLDALPENVRTAIAGYEVRSFLRDTLVPAFSLTEDQHRGVARFIMEVTLGNVPTSQMAAELSRIAGVDANTALQIIKELEVGLLGPLGLTLTGLAAPAGAPEVVVNEEGRETLRYASADDLLADIADLSPDERDRFLQDARGDNRVIVASVLSQLKLGADGSGRPLSFRQLVAAEATEFTVQDWSDLARTDPDALAEPDILRHIAATPLGAMVQGRDPAAGRDIVLQFNALDDEARRILVDRSTADAIGQLVRPGLVPPTHAAAVGRIVFFIVTGQANLEQVAGLLTKVGLNAAAADAAARTVSSLVASLPPPETPEPQVVVTAPAAPAAPRNPGLNVPNAGSRTILDLRNPRP